MVFRKITPEETALLEVPPDDVVTDLRARIERVLTRLVGEVEKRTDTAEKMHRMSEPRITALIKTCRDSLQTLASADPGGGGGNYTVVTKMPFDEDGEGKGSGELE